jgi:hypothetical protein
MDRGMSQTVEELLRRQQAFCYEVVKTWCEKRSRCDAEDRPVRGNLQNAEQYPVTMKITLQVCLEVIRRGLPGPIRAADQGVPHISQRFCWEMWEK